MFHDDDDADDDDVAVRWILKNLGDDLTEADIDDMIADVDTDGSGWVDYNGMTLWFCHETAIIGSLAAQHDFQQIPKFSFIELVARRLSWLTMKKSSNQ